MSSFSAEALSAVISVNVLKGHYKVSSGIPQVENAKFSLSVQHKYFLHGYCPLCKGCNMCWAVCCFSAVLLLPSVWLRRWCAVTAPVWSGFAPLRRWKAGLLVAQFLLALSLHTGGRQISSLKAYFLQNLPTRLTHSLYLKCWKRALIVIVIITIFKTRSFFLSHCYCFKIK